MYNVASYILQYYLRTTIVGVSQYYSTYTLSNLLYAMYTLQSRFFKVTT